MRRRIPWALQTPQHPADELLELARHLLPGLEHLDMRRLLRGQPGGHVRDAREPETAHAPGPRSDLRRMTFIQMKAPALHQDRHALERPTVELALVTRGAGLGEPRNVPVRDAHRIADSISHAREARAEYDRDARLQLAEFTRDDGRRLRERTAPRDRHGLLSASPPLV